MFQWLSANRGGYKPMYNPLIKILFNEKAKNKKCETRSASADFVALRETLRNTRRITRAV
jgi:hypothetical protein